MKTKDVLGTAFLAAAAGLALVPAPAQAQHMSMPMRAAIATQSLHRASSSTSDSNLSETFSPDAKTAIGIVSAPNAQAAVKKGLPQAYAEKFNQCTTQAPRARGQVRVNFQSGAVTAAQAQKAIDCMAAPSAGQTALFLGAVGVMLVPAALMATMRRGPY